MAKGIQGISFLDHPIESGQIVRLPNLKNCTVYGLMANGLPVSLIADMESETYKKLKTLGEDSQVKWIVGKVNHLGKGGMDWVRIYTDTNNNRNKDPNEKWRYDNKGKTLQKRSKADLYNIGDRYERTDILPVWFPKAEKFKPAIYWVEPFLIHPELHFSKNPKGFFLISIDKPQPYEAFISGNNFNRINIFKELTDKKESNRLEFYYGDTLELEVTTVQIPDYGELLIEIYNSEDKLVSDPEMSIGMKKQHISVFNDTELNKYAQEIYKVGTLNIPLDIKYKPNSQQKKTTDYLRFKISYKPLVEHQFYEKDTTTIVRDNIPDIPEHVKIQAREMNRKIKDLDESLKSEEYKQQEKSNQPEDIPLNGYVAVYFNDTKSYIEEREIQVANKMVEVGSESLIAPENDPCHYTKITAERVKDVSIDFTPEIIMIFDESTRNEGSMAPEIHIISGDNEKAELRLKVDLDTENQCRLNKHTPGGKSVFTLNEDTARIERLNQYKVDVDEMTLSPRYIYIKDNGALFPLNYFCLKDVKPITYFIPIETCRYKHNVKILVYPDIKFWATVEFNAKSDYLRYVYQDTTKNNDKGYTYGYRIGRGKQYNKTKINEYNNERNRLKSKTKRDYNLDIGYNYNGKEYSLQDAISPLFKLVDFCMGAYSLIQEISSSDDTEKLKDDIARNNGVIKVKKESEPGNNKLDARHAARKALPIRIEVERPSFTGAICGCFAPSRKNPNKIGFLYTFELQATPMISVKGSMDMLFYAQFIPTVGQALLAINKVVRNDNLLTFGVVNIDYYINLVIKGTLTLKGEAVSYHSIDGWQGLANIEDNIKVTVNLEAGVSVNISIQIGKGSDTAGVKLDAEARIEGAASVDINFGYDRIKDKGEANLTFNGVDAKIWVNLNAKKKQQKDKLKEVESKPQIVQLIEPKKPWKIEILDLSTKK